MCKRIGTHSGTLSQTAQQKCTSTTPAGQSMHMLAPAKLYRPAGQMLPAAFDTDDAAGHAYPAAQSPLHVATDKPCVLPNFPAGQSMHVPALARLYRPTAQSAHDPAQ
jgi:hypothetical protein